ncbi:MAG TPA: hypothetical protein VF160_12410 [Candidatus Dormibacteraeota bacterium]
MDARSLEGLLGFGDEDLAANRAGELSAAQARRLQTSGVWRLVVGPPVVVGGALLALLPDLSPLSVMGLVLAGLGLYICWKGFAYLVDGRERTVAYLTAPLARKVVQGRYGRHYFARIGPVSKEISLSVYDQLPEGMPVHLYYAPGCRTLLSLEPAAAEEPRPPHPFGPDAAHVWDRVRWTWVLITVGALGCIAGGHDVLVAHPARPVAVHGTVSSYSETHGKSTARYLYLSGDPNSYTPQAPSSYTPPVPSLYDLVNEPVTLYVNDGSRDVIGLVAGGQLYAADWYLHPEHQTTYEIVNGLIVGVLSLAAMVAAAAWLVIAGLRARASTVTDAPSARYMPPSVRPASANLPAGLLLGVILAVTAGLLAAFTLTGGHL